MNEFIAHIKLGINHVLDLKGYDHILFLIVLVVIYQFKDWKKVIWLVTLFTIGLSIILILSTYGVVSMNSGIIKFLIPVIISIIAVLNILTSKKTTNKTNRNLFFALIFGLIHGLGFSNYLAMLIRKSEHKLIPLLEFSIGIEIAQILIAFSILFIGHVALNILNIRRFYWITTISAIILGITLKMAFERVLW